MQVNRITKKISILLLEMLFMCCMVSKAQDTLRYEFECDYSPFKLVCSTHWIGDSELVVLDLFNELYATKEVIFRFQENYVYLTIGGQEDLFFGKSPLGSWNMTENESERFTIKWDSSHCSVADEIVYRFEFVPYYDEKNPYIIDDGTMLYHHYDDITSYYWTKSAGVIAFKGDWLFVRNDYEFLKQCILELR